MGSCFHLGNFTHSALETPKICLKSASVTYNSAFALSKLSMGALLSLRNPRTSFALKFGISFKSKLIDGEAMGEAPAEEPLELPGVVAAGVTEGDTEVEDLPLELQPDAGLAGVADEE